MLCPHHKIQLLSAIFHKVEVNYCPVCLGLWFEQDELRQAKDEADKNLNWLDIDLWKEAKKFKISSRNHFCPSCRMPLYEVYYGDSGIVVDVCNLCQGIWLDRAEFKKIILWLKQQADKKVLNEYTKNLLQQGIEVFFGPETMKEEISDFLTILKLLNYKFTVQHPIISKIISQMPR